MTSAPDAEVDAGIDSQPLTAVAGWTSVLPVPRHPIAAWLDLMDVVEALCPEWPPAEPTVGASYRL
jgi:hypothetical protein